jgi:hypothetical protein
LKKVTVPGAPTKPGTTIGKTGGRALSHTKTMTVRLRNGCRKRNLRVSGRGVKVVGAVKLRRGRCRVTVRISPGAKIGRRDLIVGHGKKARRIRRALRIR